MNSEHNIKPQLKIKNIDFAEGGSPFHSLIFRLIPIKQFHSHLLFS